MRRDRGARHVLVIEPIAFRTTKNFILLALSGAAKLAYRSFALLGLAVFGLALFSHNFCLAQQAITGSAGANLNSTDAKKPSVSAIVTVDNSADTNREEPFNSTGTYSLLLVGSLPKYKLTGTVEGGYVQNYNYELKDPRANGYVGRTGDWKDTTYAITRSLTPPAFLDGMYLSLAAVQPTSYLSRKRDLIAGVGPGIAVEKQWGRFSLTQSLKYKYYFYRYDFSAYSRPNSTDSLVSASDGIFRLTSKWYLEAVLIYDYSWNIYDTTSAYTSTSFGTGYEFTRNFTAALSIDTNRASTLSDDGSYYRFSTLDPRETQVTASMIVSM